MTRNIDLMRSAKASLKGKWGLSALTTLVMYLIIGASAAALVGPLLVTGPLILGYILYLRSVRDDKENAKLETLFSGFNDFGRSFVAYILMNIFIILWSFLLIIPGIVMSLAYSMTMFIIADDSEISGRDAIRKSRDMMRGYKWKLFCLYLRFIGWAILVVISFGIGLFWLEPYVQMSFLKFYDDVKADYNARNAAPAAV